MSATELYNRRAIFTGIAVIAVLFLAVLYYAFEDEATSAFNPDPALIRDNSPIGKKAFAELLKIRGYQVDIKVMDQVQPEDYNASLVIYFLSAGDSSSDVRSHFKQLTAAKGPLVIVPKFKLLPNNPQKNVDTLRRSQIDSVIDAVCDTNIAHTVRHRSSIALASKFNDQPDVVISQFVVLNGLTTQIADHDSIFYGSYTNAAGGTLNVLADPDITSVYALRKVANAKLILAIVNSLMPTKNKRIIISYNGGGGSRSRNPLIALFHFPAIILTVFFLIMVAALTWMGRWKKLRYLDDPPKLNRKQQLISAFGNYFSYGKIGNKRILQRYFQIRMRQTAKMLAAPGGLDEQQQIDWLKKFCRLKGIEAEFESVKQEVVMAQDHIGAEELDRISNTIYRITEKLIANGTRKSSLII